MGEQRISEKHKHTRVHQTSQKSQSGVSSLTSYFSSACGPIREPCVIEAEVKFAYFLGEHHIPLSISDQCAKLLAVDGWKNPHIKICILSNRPKSSWTNVNPLTVRFPRNSILVCKWFTYSSNSIPLLPNSP